ncbi:AlwI family type II restriction endonuclease [Spiroplasma sp. SV19]|uniref:AlwI family type II restriction endonuclease n=1 Tax=Spiroplasma sp. SV19 TaxID=2570468 RepID=UPI0024B7A29E|nr:AlwI family type II restriction endonuclease [Spiroplasma sp. SV19]WHQ37516.1 AlwI family type II restriction endonuclease [Spiroplasma sp. SV19]
MKWVQHFELNELIKEIKILENKNKYSKHAVLKHINGPLRLEFLIALILQKKFPELTILANYKTDDEGIPTSYAPGGNSDIICNDGDGTVLFEVTLLTGTIQNIREMPSIVRHLKDTLINYINSFSVLVCPKIYEDTIEYSKFVKYKDNLDIIPISISEFISKVKIFNSIRDFKKN